MKKLFSLIFVSIFLLSLSLYAGAVQTDAPSGWNVYGRIIVGGVPEDMVLIKLSDLNTKESVIKETMYGGEFNFDITELKNSVSGNQLEIIFCHDSWQCVEVSEKFSYTGFGRGKEFVMDLPAMEAYYNNYIVRYVITKDGGKVEGVASLQNLRTAKFADSEDMMLEDGEFLYNLADLKYGYLQGDIIQVCYDSLCNDFEVDGKAGFEGFLRLEDAHAPVSPYGHSPKHRYSAPEEVVNPEPEEQEEQLPEEILEEPEEQEEPVILPGTKSNHWVWVLVGVIFAVIIIGYFIIKGRD